MARFNIDEYETVAERLARCRRDHPDLRVATEAVKELTEGDPNKTRWVVFSRLFLNADDQQKGLAWSTGLASEIDGIGGMANEYSAIENCETSAVGRALANAGYHGDKRPSREEMEKVRLGKELKRQKQVEKQQAAMLNAVSDADLETLHELWKKASYLGIVDEKLNEAFKARGELLKK
ncbi:MAG: hypothetical protein WAN89_02845 [Lawsonella sp.]